MAVHLDATNYLQNTSNEDWGNLGTVFVTITPTWSYNDFVQHQLLIKAKAAFDGNGWLFAKGADSITYIGWFSGGVDYRLQEVGGVFGAGRTDNHLFLWNQPAPLRQYWFNGVNRIHEVGAFTVPTGVTHFTLGCLFNTTISDPATASFAEFGRWNRQLSAPEIAILQSTGCPLSVPEGLRQYHPLINPSISGADLMGNVPLTVTGAPAATAHPRVFYPSSGYVGPLPAAPMVTTIEAPLVSNAFQIFAPTVTVVAPAGALMPPVIASPFQLFAPSVSVAAPSEGELQPPLLSAPFTVYAPMVSVAGASIQEDVRELEPHNLKVRIVDFVGGDDLRITRTYIELPEGVIVTKGYLTIKRRAKDDADADAVVQKSIDTNEQMSGRILDNDTTGGSIELFFDLSHSETALLTPLIPYHYDVQVHTIGSAVYTCEKGVIVMQQGVTEATS